MTSPSWGRSAHASLHMHKLHYACCPAALRLTVAAADSQRDVPGMTRNAIPILVDEGVQAITIGVNGGSAPPGVPKNTPFVWRDKPSGKEIITVVHPGMPSR